MPITLPLKEMSIEEKIGAMESIWNDLCGAENSIMSPPWHEAIL